MKKKAKTGVDVDAIELKTIELRVNGIKEATQRSRYAFIVMTVATATILVSLWNSVLSWDRGLVYAQRSFNQVIADNQKTLAEEWLKNMTINVGLLGVRISINDLSVLGSASLLITSVWFFFSQKRENRAIVSLLRYCNKGFIDKKLSENVCRYVYEGVVQNLVFIDLGGGDKPIKGIVADDEKPQSIPFVRTMLRSLIFLPPITILMIVYSDIVSLLFPSYLRDSSEKLFEILFNGYNNVAATKLVMFDLFALLSCIYTFYLGIRIREFSKAISETIEEYKITVLPDYQK